MVTDQKLVPFKEFHETLTRQVPGDAAQKDIVSTLNETLQNRESSLREYPCLCGNTSFSLIASRDRMGIAQKTVMCQGCGLIQSNPRLAPEAYQEFYQSDAYRRLFETEQFAMTAEKYFSDGRGNWTFEKISQNWPWKTGTDVLEVGAGGGWNLVPFIARGGRVCGYEYSARLVALGRQRGIDLIQGGADQIQGTFDIIILNHVIEHFPLFFDTLAKILTHLRKNGIVFIGTPNMMHFDIGQLQMPHIFYFTPKTLRYFLSHLGLRQQQYYDGPGNHMAGVYVHETDSQMEREFLKGHFEEMQERFSVFSRQYYWNRLKHRIRNLLTHADFISLTKEKKHDT